ncbi:MAG: LysR family transcriptional regulator [Hyphomicrobiaceae bacterium]|nr:LysR family transcriptional regulator [Hyphomicrobiaceae bacterium]
MELPLRPTRLTLRQLAYFEAVVRHKHFGRAAEACAVSQPALSVQIQELERELGVVLVERGRGSVALTPQGEFVAQRARRILGEVQDLMDSAPRADALGAIRLGVIPTIAPYLMPAILGALGSGGAAARIQVRETQTQRLLEELEQGSLDLLLAALPVSSPGIEAHALFCDRFFLAVPASSDIGPRIGSIAAVAPHRLLLLEEGHCLRDQALSVCSAADKDMLASLGATSLATLIELVAAGMGVTLLPELCLPSVHDDRRVRIVPFRGPAPFRTVGLVWRKSSGRKATFRRLGELIADARRSQQRTVAA